ncbi:MAG: hypothetical protein FWG87_14335 [Defluviitaleaceae bacterium]|nr:hypothetical protein [Defluviitaleaceae bacterium]
MNENLPSPYNHWGVDFCCYSPPPPEMIKQWTMAYVDVFKKVCSNLKMNPKNYKIDGARLREALIRTDRRYLYYHVYHKGMKMDEIKRMAELCYWSMRLNVIIRTEDNAPDELTGDSSTSNSVGATARISAGMAMSLVHSLHKRYNYPCKVSLLEEEHEYLVYTLTYRLISRDILVLFMEGLLAEAKLKLRNGDK